ncbi:Hvo_1808 family surface protein [Natrialba sp. PRR66]|uniref:Hvo_1808 family surface protein n=1 Tax=Natrialba sp. PRR66 TaxID=3098146 RepID=UPI002B1D8697|nr:Hvo_1808 family surface protein [Natrialba sp. PRR66]
MNSTRTRLLGGLAVFALLVLVVAGAGGFLPFAVGPPSDSDENGQPNSPATDDRPADPSTNDTIGYVDGYWYDDELPVDTRDNQTLAEGELDAVISRSMARVEVIRNLTFEEDVSVDVVSREEYQDEQTENGSVFTNATGAVRLQQNVNYEALFMVDRNTDAADAAESLYGGSVNGYYDPETEQIVIVSESSGTPTPNEPVLGHELVHALQDQQFGLSGYERETIDQDNAVNGLIEGDASWVDAEYERRCGEAWACLQPERGTPGQSDLNWGLYLTIYQPYDDGPDYVEFLLEQATDETAWDAGEYDWEAVNAAYDDPPASSAETIRPGEERDPASVEVADRSSEGWQQLEVDGAVANETVGEAGMVSMFTADAFEWGRQPVIEQSEFLESSMGYDFDQPETDGWAGDELVTYVTDDAADAAAGGSNETVDDAVTETGYVWRTEWTTTDDAEAFAGAYLELLANHNAEPVDDRQNTYEIESDYPGAYYLDVSGETVSIVRAPSVAELDAVEDGAAPAGDDTITASAGGTGDDGSTASDDSEDDQSLIGALIPDSGVGIGAVALGSVLILATGGWIVLRRTHAVSATVSSLLLSLPSGLSLPIEPSIQRPASPP